MEKTAEDRSHKANIRAASHFMNICESAFNNGNYHGVKNEQDGIDLIVLSLESSFVRTEDVEKLIKQERVSLLRELIVDFKAVGQFNIVKILESKLPKKGDNNGNANNL